MWLAVYRNWGNADGAWQVEGNNRLNLNDYGEDALSGPRVFIMEVWSQSDFLFGLFLLLSCSTGLFTGSAWTRAAPGEASALAWPSSRSSPWWLSICSSCMSSISESNFLALRTSSIIRSPPLPGQGKHHRARVARQTSSPHTSWTLSEEASCALFFCLWGGDLSKNRPFLWPAVQHSYQCCHCNLRLLWRANLCFCSSYTQPFYVDSCLLSEMQELCLLVAEDAFEQCCSRKTFVLLSYSSACI